MLKHWLRFFSRSYQQSGAFGGGGGAGSPGPTSPGASSGAPGTGTPSSSPASVALTDDSLITFEGQAEPVSFRDYRGRFMPRDQFDKARNTLLSEAQRLDARERELQAQSRQHVQRSQQQQQPPADPMADVRAMALIDGQTLGQLYDRMQREGIGPLAQWAQQMNQVAIALNKRLDGLHSTVGSITERHSSADFEGELDKALGTLGEGIDVKDKALRDLATSLYLSYEPGDELKREFPALLKGLSDGLRKFYRALDQKERDAALQRRRQFPSPGGNATPGKPAPYQFENARQIASRFFDSEAAANT